MLYNAADRVWTARTFRFTRISTLTVDASLRTVAIFVTSTSDQTASTNTRLSSIALTVAGAGLCTYSVDAFFSARAIVVVATNHHALTVLTNISAAIQIVQAFVDNTHTPIFCRTADSRYELGLATAHGCTVYDGTFGVCTTGTGTRIDTSSVHTS